MACWEGASPSHTSEKCIEEGVELEFVNFKYPSDVRCTESATFGFAEFLSGPQLCEVAEPPNISHELNVAKSILQSGSSNTGDNLFDHLADIIRRAVNEPRENIVDYFEEYSYNLREQKFRIKEPFKWTLYEPPDVERARRVLSMMKPTFSDADTEFDVCTDYKPDGAASDEEDNGNRCGARRMLAPSENIQHLHLYWSLCGFNILEDEAVQLSIAIRKIQYLPIVKHARFWGKIHGLKKPYYIVEARLTPDEMRVRLEAMKCEMIEKMHLFADEEHKCEADEDPELTPGYSWRDHSEDALSEMKPGAAPVPKSKSELKFNIPPEPVGAGVNKLTYFVVNSLLDDWIELPIVTPKQVQVSRKIKRLLTGDLEADVVSFPEFPGNEKHFLRAMIARITAGTYIAPKNFYRRMTRKERMEAMGEDCLAEEEGEGEELDGEEGVDNDAFLVEDDSYEPDLRELSTPSGWVHVRPNILNQGRVRWFDVEKARKQLEKGDKSTTQETCGEDDVDEIEDESEDDEYVPEVGPILFSNCGADETTEHVQPWSPRLSSLHNKISRLTLMRSNLWPGAFAFSIDKYSDCIYLGWGCKYTARNTLVPHLPPVHDEYETDKFVESTDPDPQMELAYETWLRRKDNHPSGEDDEEEEETDSCKEVV